MAKQKLTPNQIAYNKEVKRIEQAIKRNEKQGYFLEEKLTFVKPDKITKNTISELKSITPKRLRAASVKIDLSTGEVVKNAKEEWKDEIKKSMPVKSKKAKREEIALQKRQTIDIVETTRKALEQLTNESNVNISGRKAEVIQIFEDNLTYYGKKLYGDYLLENEFKIFNCIDRIIRQSDDREVEQSFVRLAKLLNGGDPLNRFQLEHLREDAESTGVDSYDFK